MELIHTIKVNGRACCAIGEEVWIAKQMGGLTVYSARSGEFLTDVDVAADGSQSAQVTHLTAVFDEVWIATNRGEVYFFNATQHTCKGMLRVPGAEKKVQVVQLCFNGHTALVATGSGSVYVHDPFTRKRLATLSTAAVPCTAVTQFYSFVVGGDEKGGLYVWDPFSAECLCYHGESKSQVGCLLHETSTGTLWVARANENVDIYTFSPTGGLALQRRLSGIGKVTGMTTVSATVVATTLKKMVVQIDAATAKIVTQSAPLQSHTSFVRGCCKAMHREVAQVWTLDNDTVVQVWKVTGQQVPVVSAPLLPPAAQAAVTSSAQTAALRVCDESQVKLLAEQQRRVDMAEDLRKSREEAQELRLRLATREESWHTVEEELRTEKKLRKELEEQIVKLTKEVTEITSKVSTVERERNTLQGELTQLRTDLSKANTIVSTKQTEKSAVEQELSQEKTNKSTLEQRLRDSEAKLASLQAEHRRLCESTGNVATASSPSTEVQEAQTKNSATLVSELEQVRKMNQLMSSAMASMEYTIRRHEEEGKDLTALLNAYRRRVADRVSDSHLSALLLATIVRNAPRFDLECDAFTKAQLMDRNGPFLQLMQSLRATDPEAYERLVHYLQNPVMSENMNVDMQALLDHFITLAAKEGDLSGEDIVSFKRSIPGLVDGTSGVNVTVTAPTTGLAGAADAAVKSLAALLQNNLAGRATTAGEGNATANRAADEGHSKQEQVVSSTVIRELRRPLQTLDENYIREQQAMFEFILKTRRLLVESLALLYKRTASARQVVDALFLNSSLAGAAVMTTAMPAAAAPRKSLQPLQNIFGGIIRELDTIASEVVKRFLTLAEKQRLGIAAS